MRTAACLGAIAASAAVVFAPVLMGGFAFADGDVFLQYYPLYHMVRGALLAGESWLWVPGVMTGFPLAASVVGGLLSPITLGALWLFETFAAYHVLVAFNLVLTGGFLFALARRLGLGVAASLFAGFTLMWSAAYVSYASNITASQGYWLLPGILWAGLEMHTSDGRLRRLWFAVLGILIAGLSMLAAHPQWVAQGIAVGFAWAVFLDWRRGDSEGASVLQLRRWRTTLWTMAVFTAGVLLALPQIVLSGRYLPLSARQSGIELGEAFSGGLTWLDPISYVLPGFNIPYLMANPGFLYLGALPLLLVIVSWRAPASRPVKFFRWLSALALAASFQYSPVFLLLHAVPGLGFFRGPSRWMYAGNVGLAVLVGLGLKYVKSLEGREMTRGMLRRMSRVVFWGAAALGLWNVINLLFPVRAWLFAVLVRYFDAFIFPRTTGGLSLAHYHAVIDRGLDAIWSGTTFPHPVFTVSVAAFVLGAMLLGAYRRGTLAPAPFAALAFALTAIELTVLASVRLAFVPAAMLREPPRVAQAIVRREASAAPFRIFSFMPGATVYQKLDAPFGYEPVENVTLQQNLLAPSVQLLYDLDSFDNYDNLMDRRSSRVLGYLGSDRATFGERLAIAPISFDEKVAAFTQRLPMLARFNVKYLVSAYPLTHPGLRLISRFEVTRHAVPLELYELTEVWPRYYLAGGVRTIPPADEESGWKAFVRVAQDEPTVDLIECDTCPAVRSAARERVAVVVETASRYTFEISTGEPRWFVFGQNMLPGWRASIDGAAAAVYRANYLNQALAVPAGRHEVVFSFDPFRFTF